MARIKTPKNLEVDGTAKLAARSKPSDKHEKAGLNIEEATVASPRPSRKRAGDYFDFDGEEPDAEPSSKPAKITTELPKKKAKTSATSKVDHKHSETDATVSDKAKKAAKSKNIKAVDNTKDESTKEKKPKAPKAAKTNSAVPKDRQRSPKKSKTAATDISAEGESSNIAPELAMDESPFEKLEAGTGNNRTVTNDSTLASKGPKSARKLAKESKPSKAKAVVESSANVVEGLLNDTGASVDKAKKVAKSKASKIEAPATVVGALKSETKAGSAKTKRMAKDQAPTVETAKDNAKAGAEEIKRKAKTKAPTLDPAIEAVGNVKEAAEAVGEKVKKMIEPKEGPKSKASNQKKRKSYPDDTAEIVKADILEPLSEHIEESVKKKQKKQKSKSVGETVGDMLSEGASVVGGFASNLLGGAAQAVVDVKKSAESSVDSAKGKGTAVATNVADSLRKAATNEPPVDIDEDLDESDGEPNDRTAAILAGLESDGDDATSSGPGFQKGYEIPKIPDAKKVTKKGKASKTDDGPGVVYVGRIPHGFYEHEMRQYFSQFGEINRLRLSRNKKTGASRHWAFVEFRSAAVAGIVAETMNNYLLFEHILKCSVVPQEQLHEDVWKGADKRFKSVPWNKMEGKKHEVPVSKEHWDRRISNEEERRESKQDKTKSIGYEFEAPKLKGTRDLIKSITEGETVEEEKSLVTAGDEDGQGTLVVSEEIKTKRSKKVSKGGETTTTIVSKKTKRALEAGEDAAGTAVKKAKKAMKTST